MPKSGKKFTAAAQQVEDRPYSLDEAKKHYLRAAKASTKPFIYLSAGVSNAEFLENLEVGIQAGADFSGVLCGRATWQEGIPVFAKGGRKALADWLAVEGVKNIKALNDVLARGAKPWHVKYGGLANVKAVKAAACR